MNTRQKIALWVGISVLVLMLLFPPFWTRDNGVQYGLYAHPPHLVPGLASEVRPDILHTELIVAALITVAAVLTLADRRAADRADA